MARKNLNDDIFGDRAAIRGGSNMRPFSTDEEGWSDDVISGSSSKSGSAAFKSGEFGTFGSGSGHSCYLTHPPLKIPGTELVVYGGSCLHPAVKDADVYIGFDGGMAFTKKQFPWNAGDEILFKIRDMDAPQDKAEFKKLVNWTAEQLIAGRKVHCGCIGGHGRTGTFFAALVKTMAPETEDPIMYVRENYCKKTVETKDQVMFLVNDYGAVKTDWRKGIGSTGAIKETWRGSDSKYPASTSIKTAPAGKPRKMGSTTTSAPGQKGKSYRVRDGLFSPGTGGSIWASSNRG